MKRNKCKKLVTILLVMLMVLTSIPATVFAETAASNKGNSLEGKTISILGASISTYEGTSNGVAASETNSTIKNNVKYYPNSTIPDVSLNDTWWMQVADDLGLELLVNNSWSGSALFKTTGGTVGAYVDRCVQLHDDTGENAGKEPDIIGIQLGTNDFNNYPSTLGTADIDYESLIADNGDGTFTYQKPTTSLEAAAIVLHRISVRYPDAEVYYLTLSDRAGFTESKYNSLLEFNKNLTIVCEHFGAHMVGIYGSEITSETIPYYMGDGSLHPNKLGMDVYAEAFKRAVLAEHAEVSAHKVAFELERATVDYGADKIVVDGDSFTCKLTPEDGYDLDVKVKMNGEDVTAGTFNAGTVTIESVTGDVTIEAAGVEHVPQNYRWEFDGNDLICDTSSVNSSNSLTKMLGDTVNGVFSKTCYRLEKNIILEHDKNWGIEWKCEGTWKNSNSATGGRMFTTTNINAEYNARYIFKSSNNYLIAMGEKTQTGSHNYGIALSDYGIDGSELHTYRLENRVNEDNTNMIYLWVDGQEVGALNNYYIGTNSQGTTSNWLSGKSFSFSYIGTDSHGLNDCSIEYIQVCENGKSIEHLDMQYDDHMDLSGKTVEIIDAGQPTSYQAGYGKENGIKDTAVVTLEDDTLIATGIGTAKVVIDGTVYEVVVDKAKINLIVIMGQSNAGNHFENATSDTTCPVGTAYWWGNGKGINATEPVPYTQPSKGFHTPLLAELYAQSAADGNPVKNVMIWHEGITSKNGKSIVKWAASSNDTSGTDDTVTMIEKCRNYFEEHGDKYEIVNNGVYWLQGESDTSMDPELYKQCFYAMWDRLEAAGMEYMAFLRVRRGIYENGPEHQDLYYSAALSAQIDMINCTPNFYMATTLTENWTGTEDTIHTVDISDYITMSQIYGSKETHTDQYGNDATYKDGKLTTSMKCLYGSNNKCHYGKFGYGAIGADAAYNMHKALNDKKVSFVCADTSGYSGEDHQKVLLPEEDAEIDITHMNEDLSFKAMCGSVGGTLSISVKSNGEDITSKSGVIINTGDHYGAVSVDALKEYENVSVDITYNAIGGEIYEASYKIVKNAHEFGDWQQITAPTCTEPGVESRACDCGHSETRKIDETGHEFKLYISDNNASAEADGTKTAKCSRCDVTDTIVDEGSSAVYKALNGKVISILGDSISTFEGYIPKADGFNLEHLTRYPQDDLVTDVTETWWMQVINTFNAKLGINDSWRGATVSGAAAVTSGSTGPLAAMSNLTRIQNLGSNGTPDVIMFYGGTNDLAHVSKVGSFDANTAPDSVDLETESWDNLAEAYAHTLLRLQHYYPDAQIVAILPAHTKSYYSDTKLTEANKILAEICQHYNVSYVDLCEAGVTAEYLPDGIHPGAEGMDIITDAVVKSILDNCSMEVGENVVYPVRHSLNNVKASLGHYKGISAGKTFSEELSGSETIDVKITMGGEDITESCYSDRVIKIESVSGPIEITASAKVSISDHLQQRPEKICCNSNLWQLLEHDDKYFYVDDWTVHSSGNVKSVTFPVNEGEKIAASSFGKSGTNGGSMNGIRTTFFCEDGSIISMLPADVYAEYSTNGYITAPKGATAVNIPMWTASDDWEIYIESADHTYGDWQQVTAPTCGAEGQDKRICSVCGAEEFRDTRISGEDEQILVSSKLPDDYFADKTIMCIGDSLTNGTGVEEDEKYYAVLGDLLGANTLKRGTSGATMAPGGHLPNKFETVMTESYLKDVDVVSIFLGVNDWNNGVKDGTFRGSLKYDPSATYYELGEFGTDDTTTIYGATKMWCEKIAELKATDALKDTEFVFMTPVITCRNRSVTMEDNWSAEKENVFGYTLRQYCNAIMETAAAYDIPVLDLNMYSGMYYHSEEDNNVDYFGGDGIHPGANGHRMIANALAEFLLDNYSYEDGQVTDCGHTYKKIVKAPTCLEDGYTKYKCEECYYSYEDAGDEATGNHTYENGRCSQCGEDEPLIPENWCAVPLSKEKMSESLAYKIEAGTLTFHDFGEPSAEGYGVMPDYSNLSASPVCFDITPWYKTDEQIEQVIFDETISHIGSYTLVNINEISEIIIKNPYAETVCDAVLFNDENRAAPLDIFAASTISTEDKWIRGSMNRPISQLVPDATMYLTDHFDLAEELNDFARKIQSGNPLDVERMYEIFSAFDELAKNEYTISDYAVDIANAEGCYELIKSYTSGTCGEGVNYKFSPTEENGKLKLTISGSGKMNSYSAEDAPWNSVVDWISDISVDELVELSSVEAFPKDAIFHMNINSESYEFIKANGFNVCFDEMRILLIGNSHTRNYSAFLSKILNDMDAAGLKTKVTVDTSITSSIGLYSGRNSNAAATYRSHLEGLETKFSAYKKLSEQKYDLIIVQDYLESMVDSPEDFTEGIASFISKVDEIISENGKGNPQIAWFADWIDIRNTGGDSAVLDNTGASIKLEKLNREDAYAKSLDSITAVETAKQQGFANMPDFIIQGSTIKQNAMSSYLGKTKMWDVNRYCLLESDTTHLTGELGCYIVGAGVMSSIASHYGAALTDSNGIIDVPAALTIENGPAISGSGSQYEGAVNNELINVIREIISSPNEFKQSVYTVDPMDAFTDAINKIEWDTNTVTDEASALSLANEEIVEATGGKADKITIKMKSYTDENNFVLTVHLRHGYSVKELDITVHNHTYINTTTHPTCTDKGYDTYTCSCGDSYIDNYVDSLGHKEVVFPAVAPDCENTGLTEGSHCDVCGNTIVEQEVVDALGHDCEHYEGMDATCTAAGYEPYEECKVCDYTTYKVIPMLKHDIKTRVEEATCTEDGYTVEYCKCGYEKVIEDEKAKGHKFTNYKESLAPKCETVGKEKATCDHGCGTVDDRDIPATGHTEVADEPVDPTCTEAGLTEGSHCSVCEAIIVKQEVVDKLAHDTVKHEAKEATCTEVGWDAYETCSRCDYTTYVERSIVDHKYGEEQYQVPTAEEDGGYYEVCSVCGDSKWNKTQTYAEYIEEGVAATTIKVEATGSVKTEYVTVKWTKSEGFAVTRYNVYRSTSGKEGTFSQIGQTTGMSYVDKKATVGKTYYYKVVGVREYDGDVYKTKESNVDAAKINKVTAAQVKATPMYATTNYANKGLKIMWTSPNIKVDGYQVYRSTSKNGTYKKVKTTKSTTYSWTNTGLKVGKKYYYKVRGYKKVNGKTVYTKFSSKGYRYVLKGTNASIASKIVRSDAVTAKKATKVISGIKVTWSKKTSIKCNRYEVWRATSKSGTYKKIGTTKNKYYTDKKATKGKTYYYKIKGYRTFGKATAKTNYSNVVSGKR